MPAPPLARVRPEVRAERAYRVAVPETYRAKLDQNESPFDLPAEVKRAALDRFAAEPWNRYPPDRAHELAAALAQSIGVEPGAIMVGRGSNEMLLTLALVFGGPVALPRPMFALHAEAARLHGAELVEVAPHDDLGFDVDALLAAAQERDAAFTAVTTPNNPTGRSVSHDDLARLAAGVPGVLLIDEAYHEFVRPPRATELLREFPNVLVMRTFSKAMGLAGLRLGYLVGHPDLLAEVDKARVPFLVDRLSEIVALEVLAHPEWVAERVAELEAERDRLFAALGERGAERVPGDANFFLFRFPGVDSDALRQALRAQGVLVRAMGGYPDLRGQNGAPDWLRVSAGTPGENEVFLSELDAALPALRSAEPAHA